MQQKLLKYAASLKFDDTLAAKNRDSQLRSEASPRSPRSPNSPHRSDKLDSEFFQSNPENGSTFLARRMIRIPSGNIKEEQNEDSDIISLNNLSHGHASAVQEAECESDDSELAELKKRVGLVNPVTKARRQRSREQRSKNNSPNQMSPRLHGRNSPDRASP